jgi:hypothetical protein
VLAKKVDLRPGYTKKLWYQPTPRFEDGRNPLVDLFGLAVVHCIMKEAGRNLRDENFETDANALQADLRQLAFDYLFAARTTPFRMKSSPKHVSATKRVEWLQAHVIKPAAKLLDALSTSNSFMLSEWPQDLMRSRKPNRQLLVQQLEKLKDRTGDLVENLRGLQSEGGILTQDFRADYALHLKEVLQRHFPNLKPSGGTYQKDRKGRRQTGRYAKILSLITQEIFPGDRDIPHRIIRDLGR